NACQYVRLMVRRRFPLRARHPVNEQVAVLLAANHELSVRGERGWVAPPALVVADYGSWPGCRTIAEPSSAAQPIPWPLATYRVPSLPVIAWSLIATSLKPIKV